MPNVARTNAMITASAPDFQNTFSKAGKNVEDFGATVESVAGGIAIVDIGKSLVESAYNATVGLVKGQMSAIDSSTKLADTIGVSTEEFGKLSYAASIAGVSNEDLSKGLQKMLQSLDKAVHSGGDAAAAYQRLGLDAKTLANEPTAKAFSDISQALDGVHNASERIGLEKAIFGKGGSALNPLIAEGADKLNEFAANATKTGFALNEVDASKVILANEAFTQVQNTLTGAANTLAVQLSPYLQAFASKLNQAANSGGGLGVKVVGAFEAVVKGVATAADYVDLLKAGWETLRGAAGIAILGILDPLTTLIKAADYLYTTLGGTSTQFAATSDAFIKGLTEETAAAFKAAGEDVDHFNSKANSKSASKMFEDIKHGAETAAEANAKLRQNTGGVTDEIEKEDKGVEKAAKTVEELKQKVEEYGKSKEAMLAIKLAGEGATFQQIAEAQGYQKQLDALEEQKKAQEEAAKAAKKYYDETRTPAEKYAAELEHINKLVEEGSLDEDTATRARQKAADDLDKATDKKKKKEKDQEAPSLLQSGSQEAANFIANFQARTNDPQEKMLKESQVQSTYLKLIADTVTSNKGSKDTVLDF